MILVVNWFEIQLIWLSIDLRFKWFGCQSMCASNDFGCLLIWTSSDVVVNWFEIQVIRLSIDLRFIEIQVIWLSIDLRFKWVGCQLIWDSTDLDVKWFEVQVIWLSTDVWFKWFCQTNLLCQTSFKYEAFLRDFLQNWSFEAKKQSNSARLPSKMKLWSSKTKLNEAFLRDFLQNRSFEAQKRSFSAKLPSKTKLWRSKTKLFCETSFKIEALKLKNEAILRDFLQKWSFEAPKRSISARLPSKTKLWRSKTKLFCETSFKNDMSTRHLTSEFQYVLVIFKWMLQKYCACHEKVEPRHTNSGNCHTRNDHCQATLPWLEICNPSTDSASKASNIDITKREITAPATRNASFRSLFKSTTPANVFATLTNSCACHVFCNVSQSLRLPRETHFQPPKTSRAPGVLTILTSESFARAGVVQILRSSTSKSAPNLPRFNDFDFQIALARRRGANFVDVKFQKCSEPTVF